jgi:hypothetical protein
MTTFTTHVAGYRVPVTQTPDAWHANVYSGDELVHILDGSGGLDREGIEATVFTEVVLWAGEQPGANLSHADFD